MLRETVHFTSLGFGAAVSTKPQLSNSKSISLGMIIVLAFCDFSLLRVHFLPCAFTSFQKRRTPGIALRTRLSEENGLSRKRGRHRRFESAPKMVGALRKVKIPPPPALRER